MRNVTFFDPDDSKINAFSLLKKILNKFWCNIKHNVYGPQNQYKQKYQYLTH